MEKLSKEYTAAERAKVGRNAGIVGIAVNLVLFAMKITAGIIFSSVAIIADAVNNLSDAGSSIIMMVGYIFSSKPADRKHPYGHARFEYLSTLFISIIITVLGLELFKCPNSFPYHETKLFLGYRKLMRYYNIEN